MIAGVRFKINELATIFFIYLIIDVLVSFSQFLHLGPGSFFANIYGSAAHIERSLGLSSRAMGLSSGPGQHGSILALFYVFFLYLLIYTDVNKFRNIFSVFLALIGILLAQSQTSFIAITLGTIFIIFYSIVNGTVKERRTSLVVFILLLFGASSIFIIFLDELRYLYSLIELGLERNSYQVRVGRTTYVWSLATSTPLLLLIGYGKDFFGTLSGAMDNEYLYIFFIYGFFVGILFVLAIIIFVIKVLWQRSQYPKHYLMIVFTFLIGLVIAFPTAFFTDPRLIILMTSYFLIDEAKSIQQNV
ncbi:hypothetical protein [Litoribacter ruber]|uniref:hypothetical protein n=1 Tax=Litoribacter ruber TaxID=702568 RepID=UPI001BD295D1|nr:hypothetical protein [Litoribacter alkaliphilus]